MSYFVTAISTDSGKSVVSALLASVLGYKYWKPVQAGHPTDTDFIKEFDSKIEVSPERYLLSTPCSPHESAKIDNVQISLDDFVRPEGDYIIEGAGGVAVPINYKGDLMLDLIQKLEVSVVIVSNTYLGSINHTLLTIEALKNKKIPIHGIVFNGEKNEGTESIILKSTQVPFLFRLQPEKKVNSSLVSKYSEVIKSKF